MSGLPISLKLWSSAGFYRKGSFSPKTRLDMFSVILNTAQWGGSIIGSVLACWGSHNQVPQTGWLNLQKFIASQLWRLEVWNPDAGKVGSLLALWEKDLFLPSFCPYLVGCSLGVFSLCVSLSKCPHSARTSVILASTHSNDLILTWLHLLRPYFQIRPHLEVLWVRTSAYEFGGYISEPYF